MRERVLVRMGWTRACSGKIAPLERAACVEATIAEAGLACPLWVGAAQVTARRRGKAVTRVPRVLMGEAGILREWD